MTSRARRLAAKLAIAPADRLVAVSAGTRDALVEAGGGGRVLVIPNGVEVDAFGPPEGPHDPPCVLFAGYLTRRKGVGDLLQASASLRARGVDHELVLAGGNAPDDDPEMMRTLAERTGAGIRMLGPQPFEAMPDLYRGADVYCLPSWWEAMPISVLEAMASGLPVVATRVGDIPAIVEDGVSGRLVPPRDPAALSAALEEILGDPARRQAMGAAARARVVERYAATSMTAAISDLYKQLAP
jgi:glycosyltransferase involved in cell wall biosynthesis